VQNFQSVVNLDDRVYYIVEEDNCYCINMDSVVVGPAVP